MNRERERLLDCNAESALETRDQKDVDKKGSAELCVKELRSLPPSSMCTL